MSYEQMRVPVAGGELVAGVWKGGPQVVLALHGVTSSHRAWADVAKALGGKVTLVAPDLRGRGQSGTLPGPYGMAQHAADAVALLDALGAKDAVVAGHSMGGFAALVLADLHPERVRRLVLVDGGPPLPLPQGVTPEEQMARTIGPAAKRLSMTFESLDAHRAFWKAHPAFRRWTPTVEAYVDYDLVGTPPALRSSVSFEAVKGDSEDLFSGGALLHAWQHLRHEALMLRAQRGMLDEATPLFPDVAPIAARLPVQTIEGTNHYTIVLGEGAPHVAEALLG